MTEENEDPDSVSRDAHPILDFQGVTVQFISAKNFSAWLDAEREFWKWITSSPTKSAPESEYLNNRFRKLITPLLTHAQNATESPDFLRGAISLIKSQFANWPLSRSSKGRYVELMRETRSPLYALGALAYFNSLPLQSNQPSSSAFVAGYVGACSYDETSNQSDTFAKIFSDARMELEHTRADRNQINQEISSLKSSLQNQYEQERARLSAEIEKRREEGATVLQSLTSLLDEKSRALSALEDTYNAKLRLNAPVTYWKSKRKYHAKESQTFQRATAWYFLTGIILFVMAEYFLLDQKPILSTNASTLIAVSTLFGMFIWGGRLIVRRMLSHMHLESDAHERSVIAETYLALVRDEKVHPESERYALEALMRHSSDGIVSDDGAPMSTILKRPD